MYTNYHGRMTICLKRHPVLWFPWYSCSVWSIFLLLLGARWFIQVWVFLLPWQLLPIETFVFLPDADHAVFFSLPLLMLLQTSSIPWCWSFAYLLSLPCRCSLFFLDLGRNDPELHLWLALADILCNQHRLAESAFFPLVSGLASLPPGPSPVLVPGPSWSWDTLGYPPTDATFDSLCLHPSWRFLRFCWHVPGHMSAPSSISWCLGLTVMPFLSLLSRPILHHPLPYPPMTYTWTISFITSTLPWHMFASC